MPKYYATLQLEIMASDLENAQGIAEEVAFEAQDVAGVDDAWVDGVEKDEV